MVRLIHRDSGGDLWVDESRVQEYLERGHRLPDAPAPEEPKPQKPARKPRTKKE